jgi:hypothetical protein
MFPLTMTIPYFGSRRKMGKSLSLETLIIQDFIYYQEMRLMGYIFFKFYLEKKR